MNFKRASLFRYLSWAAGVAVLALSTLAIFFDSTGAGRSFEDAVGNWKYWLFLLGIVLMIVGGGFFGAFMVNRKEFLDLCTRWTASYQDRTRALIQQVIGAGGYEGLDAGAIARGLNAMIDGLWLNILLDPKACDRKEALRACQTYLAQLFPREFGRQPSVASAA